MGGKQSVVIREVESDASIEARVRGSLDTQLAILKDEVVQVSPVIQEREGYHDYK